MLVELPPIPTLSIQVHAGDALHVRGRLGNLRLLVLPTTVGAAIECWHTLGDVAPADLQLEQPAGDRAVHQGHAVRGPQAELAGGGGVGRKERRPPAAALRHEPVAETPEKCSGPGQREPFAVGRIRHDETPARDRLSLLEVFLLDPDERSNASRFGTGLRRFDRLRVEVARLEGARRLDHAGLQLPHEPLHQLPVAIAKLEETMGLAAGPPEPRRHAGRDRGGLDHERAGAAHRVENRFAADRTARRARLPPARNAEDPGGQHLRERRLDLAHPPAPLVQRPAGGVAEDRRDIADQMQRQPERRSAQLNARPLTAGRPQLIDQRVLHDLRGIEGMREKRVVDRGIDTQRVRHLELLRPIDLLHRPVETVGRIDAESPQRLENADRGAGFEHGAVERLLLAARRRGKLDRAPTDPQVLRPDGLQLPRENPLEPLERAGRQPWRLVEHGGRQRPGNRRDGRKLWRHAIQSTTGLSSGSDLLPKEAVSRQARRPGAVHALSEDGGKGLPMPREPALLPSAARMAERRQHRVSAGQDARSERPATGHG